MWVWAWVWYVGVQHKNYFFLLWVCECVFAYVRAGSVPAYLYPLVELFLLTSSSFFFLVAQEYESAVSPPQQLLSPPDTATIAAMMAAEHAHLLVR